MNSSTKGRRHPKKIAGKVLNGATRISIIGIVAILFLLPYGVTEGTTAEKTPYVIGGIVSITGHYAHWGTTLADGEKFTVKQWNGKGGINGFPIKYIPGDDGCKPDRALTITKMLVTKEKVLGIAAGGLTASVTAMSPYLNRIGVPFIFSAGGKTYDLPKEKFMFGVLPNTPIVIDYKLKWLQQRGIKRVALIADNTAYGEVNAKYTPGAAKRAGSDLVLVSRFALEDMDMTPMLARVKAKNAGGIILAAGGDGAVRNLKQMKQIGLNIPTLLPVACVDITFVKNLGSAAEGKTNIFADGNYLMVLDAIPDTNPRKKEAMGFVKAFEKEYGKKFNYGNGVGYDKMETLLRAIKAVAPPANKIDYDNAKQLKKIRADIRDWLEKTKGLELLTGTFSRSPQDHIGTTEVGMVRIIDKKWLPVE
jgi:branched-chain amino acid transport system substrate-binding protein